MSLPSPVREPPRPGCAPPSKIILRTTEVAHIDKRDGPHLEERFLPREIVGNHVANGFGRWSSHASAVLQAEAAGRSRTFSGRPHQAHPLRFLEMNRNPLIGWTVDRCRIKTIGAGLQRPECILAQRDGPLWSADARGGVM